MHDLLLDVRYALRVLWKSPVFTLVAVITLMLGIGANIVVFGVVNAVFLHPLDVSDPQNLYQLRLKPWTHGKLLTTSYPAFEDYPRQNTTFSDLAGYYGFCYARLSWGNSAKNVYGYAVTGNYFELLGVQPEIGRFIQRLDDHGPNSAPYVVLSDHLWRSAFNADPDVIGTTVRLNKDSFTVIGVAPAQFHGTEKFDRPDYFIPIVNYFDAEYLRDRVASEQAHTTFVVRSYRAQNEMAAALERTLSGLEPSAPITVQSWRDAIAATFFPARAATVAVGVMGLLAAMLAVTGIFGMAAYNVSRRMKELGIRVALGARTKHVISTAVGRPIILLGVGSLLGLLSGVFAKRLLEHVVYQANPLDPMVVLGSVLTMALLGIAASAIPALRALAVDPSKLLREE